VLVAAGLLLTGPLDHGSADRPSPPPITTATVERRTLQATTQVNGTLGYASSYVAGAPSAYTVTNAIATTGGADEASLLTAYAQAQSQYDSAVNALDALQHPPATQVAQAEAQLAQARATLTAAGASAAGPRPQDLAQANAQLAQAQSMLTAAEQTAEGPTPAQLATAQATLAQAQANLLKAQDVAQGPTAAQQAQAQAQVAQAQSALSADQAALAAAQSAYQACVNPPPPAPSPTGSAAPVAGPSAPPCDLSALQLQVEQDQARILTDEANLSAAQAQLSGLTSPQSQSEAQANLLAAQAQVQSAQAALDQLTSATAQQQAQAGLVSAQAQVAAAQAALDALTSSTTKAQARAGLASAEAQVNAAQAALGTLSHPAGEQLTQAREAVATARTVLDAARARLDAPRGVVTQLAQAGTTVAPGQVLYTLDGTQPVVLLQGSVPAWRSLAPGAPNGLDVQQLEESLKSLGYAPSSMAVDTHWDAQTTAAVKRWQKALGIPQTGTIPYGTVVFEPGPLRIAADMAALGATVQAGTAVLQATATARIVDVALDPALQASVQVGDGVSVTLPDGSTTPGQVSFVSSVATQSSGSGSGGGATPPPTIDVQITLDDPAAAGTLDQAPVAVNITTAAATDALAVPVTALLAQPGGGYVVEEVQPDGTRRLIPVTTGVFDDQQGLVQVTGTGLAPGQQVVVPST
jgi:multidrug efflux pump subunit AcrA (membrane-fusion protein)